MPVKPEEALRLLRTRSVIWRRKAVKPANNIQNINQVVVGAVEELTEQARAIASYIMENISTDYDDFVASGAQYKEDAVHVDEIVTRFHRMADEAQVLVDNITRAIQGISAAVDESANGVGLLQLILQIWCRALVRSLHR